MMFQWIMQLLPGMIYQTKSLPTDFAHAFSIMPTLLTTYIVIKKKKSFN